MNAFKSDLLRQQKSKCFVMIITLLHTACAVNVANLGGGPIDWTAPKPSKPAENDAGTSLTCRMDMPKEVSVRPKVQPIARGDNRMGARVVLSLHNQQRIAGRLVSVRDSALVISRNEARDNPIDTQTAGLLVVKNQDIQRVTIKGESRIMKGMGLGFLIGAGTGVIIGLAAGDDPPCASSGSPLAPNFCFSLTAEVKAAIGGVVLGGAGLILGSIAGAVTSNADEAIDPLMNDDLSALKPLAQFPEKEPEYLSAIK